jgi:hypothetical protein
VVEETAMKIIVEDMVETIVEGKMMDVATGRGNMRIGMIRIGDKIELQRSMEKIEEGTTSGKRMNVLQ